MMRSLIAYVRFDSWRIRSSWFFQLGNVFSDVSVGSLTSGGRAVVHVLGVSIVLQYQIAVFRGRRVWGSVAVVLTVNLLESGRGLEQIVKRGSSHMFRIPCHYYLCQC